MSIDPGGAFTVAPSSSDAAWDAFVQREPLATHMHQREWGGVFFRVFGHPTTRWVACDDTGAVRGVLPLTFVRSLLLGRHAVSVPYLNCGGPVGDAAAVSALVRVSTADALARGYRSIELRARARLPLPLEPRARKVSVLLDLPTTTDALMKGFESKLRSQVRRAAKEGAQTHHGPQELPAFYSVFRRHMRDLGTPVMPRRFFEEALAAFPDTTWVATVRHQGRPVAGAMGFRWRDEFEITWASSLIEYKRISPNMLLYWGLLERCVHEGVRRFNFGRTTPGSGPHRFKLQWGGREEPLHWYYPGSADAGTVPQKEQGRFALASRVWRRLPLSVASALGPHVVRGIP